MSERPGQRASAVSASSTPGEDGTRVTSGLGALSAALERLAEVVSSARAVPLSSSVVLDRAELVELVDTVAELVPKEVAEARWLLSERDALVAEAKREADAILDEARVRAAQLVQRSEITRQARLEAERIEERARADARRLRRGAEEWCDQQLASLQAVVERIDASIRLGREQLASSSGSVAREADGRSAAPAEPVAASPSGLEPTPFDQDEA
jgi:cell division septum initiation protein DivIVA